MIANNMEVNWDKDPNKMVELRHSDGEWYIRTRRTNEYTGPDGETLRSDVGTPHILLEMTACFGKVHVHVNRASWKRRDFKSWEQDVYDMAKSIGIIAFIKTCFGVDVVDMRWESYIHPNYSKYRMDKTNQHWDWSEEAPFRMVPHREQVEAYAERVRTVIGVQELLIANGYDRFAKKFDNELDSARRDMLDVIRFEDIHPQTPIHEVPSWAWEGKFSVCKKRKSAIEKEFSDILGED